MFIGLFPGRNEYLEWWAKNCMSCMKDSLTSEYCTIQLMIQRAIDQKHYVAEAVKDRLIFVGENCVGCKERLVNDNVQS